MNMSDEDENNVVSSVSDEHCRITRQMIEELMASDSIPDIPFTAARLFGDNDNAETFNISRKEETFCLALFPYFYDTGKTPWRWKLTIPDKRKKDRDYVKRHLVWLFNEVYGLDNQHKPQPKFRPNVSPENKIMKMIQILQLIVAGKPNPNPNNSAKGKSRSTLRDAVSTLALSYESLREDHESLKESHDQLDGRVGAIEGTSMYNYSNARTKSNSCSSLSDQGSHQFTGLQYFIHTESTSPPSVSLLDAKDAQIAALQGDVAALQTENAVLQGRIDELMTYRIE